MEQSRKGSLIESGANIAIGYSIALVSQMAIFPMFDISITNAEHATIGLFFTVISLVRGYMVRRFFNKRLHNAAMRLSGSARS